MQSKPYGGDGEVGEVNGGPPDGAVGGTPSPECYSSGSAAVDGNFVKQRSCADPAESCSKEAIDLQFNGKRRRSDVDASKGNGSDHIASSSSGITLNIRDSLAAGNSYFLHSSPIVFDTCLVSAAPCCLTPLASTNSVRKRRGGRSLCRKNISDAAAALAGNEC
jgi:hypothetical protein